MPYLLGILYNLFDRVVIRDKPMNINIIKYFINPVLMCSPKY